MKLEQYRQSGDRWATGQRRRGEVYLDALLGLLHKYMCQEVLPNNIRHVIGSKARRRNPTNLWSPVSLSSSNQLSMGTPFSIWKPYACGELSTRTMRE